MKIFISILFVGLVFTGCSNTEEQLIRRADKIHASILTIDTHCDTPMEFSDSTFDLGLRHDAGCVDFPRMIEGGLHSEFFAVFIGQGSRNDSS
ncbi:MAG TPA: membrane dipeptidase, partial [Bacteroidales bacterium]